LEKRREPDELDMDRITDAMAELQEQRDRGDVTVEEYAQRNRRHIAALRTASRQRNRAHPYSPSVGGTNPMGLHQWPWHAQPRDPLDVFREDHGLQYNSPELMPRWFALREEQRATYSARSETLRAEAWAKFANLPPERKARCRPPTKRKMQETQERIDRVRERLTNGVGGPDTIR